MDYTKKNGFILDSMMNPSANSVSAGTNIVLIKETIDKNKLEFIIVQNASTEQTPSKEGSFIFESVVPVTFVF